MFQTQILLFPIVYRKYEFNHFCAVLKSDSLFKLPDTHTNQIIPFLYLYLNVNANHFRASVEGKIIIEYRYI